MNEEIKIEKPKKVVLKKPEVKKDAFIVPKNHEYNEEYWRLIAILSFVVLIIGLILSIGFNVSQGKVVNDLKQYNTELRAKNKQGNRILNNLTPKDVIDIDAIYHTDSTTWNTLGPEVAKIHNLIHAMKLRLEADKLKKGGE